MTLSNPRFPCDEAVIKSGHDVPDCNKSVGQWVLAAAILGSSISFIDGTVVNVALPILQSSLGATVAQTQWVVEAYSLMLSALILVGGSLGDRVGRKRVFSVGVIVFGASSLWCGLAPDITQLIVSRGLQGIGAAMLVPGSLALISANFSRERRGRAIGTWSGFTAIAAGLGPVLGGWLVQYVSWRAVFWINVPLCVTVLLITIFRVPESRDENEAGDPVDWSGPILATVGLGGIVFGLVESNSRGLLEPLVVVSFVVGVVAFFSFLFVEHKQRSPMMPLSLFRSPVFAGANVLTLFLYAGLGGLLFFLPFDLIQVRGYEPTAAGAALLPFVLTMFILSRWAGGLVERYGSRLPLTIGPVIAAAGFALFAIAGVESNSYWKGMFPAIMVMSLGMAISVAPLTTTVMGAVDQRHAGVASGVNNAVSRTAGLLAVAVFGVVMIGVFERGFQRRVTALPISVEIQQQLIAERKQFTDMTMPAALDQDDQNTVRRAVAESFIDGFRVVTLITAGLAVMSGFFAWLLIPAKTKDDD